MKKREKLDAILLEVRETRAGLDNVKEEVRHLQYLFMKNRAKTDATRDLVERKMEEYAVLEK